VEASLFFERLTFGQEHFGAAKLGDRRRTKRLVQVADRIVKHPGGTLPDKLNSPADLKALYRLVGSDAVTHEAVFEPARQRTLQRMRDYAGVVLTIHDTTELDYTKITGLQKIGHIGNGKGRGYLCHNTLAVTAETRDVLGLANQILFVRPKVPKNEPREQSRRRKTRESRLWKRGAAAIGPIPEGKRWVDVCDCAADLFEYLDYKHEHQQAYVVRAQQNRWIERENEGKIARQKLFEYAHGLRESGRKTVHVPAKAAQGGEPARAARDATVRVAAGAITMPAPKNPRGEHRDGPLSLWVICVSEIDPPPGVESLEWILLTNERTENREEAMERVGWYECRPIVEEYHKGQKTGCGIETLQFEAEERLEPVIALLSVVAVFLLQLRDICRRPESQERQATDLVSQEYVDVLAIWRHRELRPRWTVAEFCYALARLGGHQNRKRDGAPGWLTLWRGWTKLQLMVEVATEIPAMKSG
jgi:hypothetical protein